MLPLVISENGSVLHLQEKETPQLNLILKELCDKLKLPRPEVYLLTGESQPYNFFTTSLTPNNAVLLINEKLVELLSLNELKTALAHELTHIKHYDALKKTLISFSQVGFLALTALWFLATEGIELQTRHSKYVITALILFAVTVTTDLYYTQFCEERANINAIEVTEEESFISMVNKIEKKHLNDHERNYKILQNKLTLLGNQHPVHATFLQMVAYCYHKIKLFLMPPTETSQTSHHDLDLAEECQNSAD